MVDRLTANTGDTVVIFPEDSYAALLSLLYEIQDIERLKEISEEHKLGLSLAQMGRLTVMWSRLTQAGVR